MKRRDFFQKTQQRYYSTRSRSNPYFREHKNNKSTYIFAGLIVAFLIILTLILILLFHPRFKIQQINVNGIDRISKTEIEQALRSYINDRVLLVFTRKNRFILDERKLIASLSSEFAFKQINVKRKNAIVDISILERTSNLIWKVGDKLYVVDLDGVINRELSQQNIEMSSNLPIFVDRNEIDVRVGDSVLKPEEITSVFKFHEFLLTNGVQFTQTEFDRVEGKWTGVLTNDGFYILFDVTGDIESQENHLAVLLKDQIKDKSSLKYIDLRFGDHVYYK